MKISFLGPAGRIPKELGLTPCEEKITQLPNADVIICFRYRHIIPWRMLASYRGRIINIHTSLLPWQRGAHPVFWAFMENTSHGVTIHEIDRGIDTGPIIVQVPVNLDDEQHTFRSAWQSMNQMAENIFLALWPGLLNITPQPQGPGGTYHTTKDKDALGAPVAWDERVAIYIDDLAMCEQSAVCAERERIEIRERV